MRGKHVGNEEGWVLKVICESHNHEIVEILVGPLFDKLKSNEHFMIVNITKSLIKVTNILLTLKENSEENVTTIKQVHNIRYAYI